jgi:hypothetical protein
MIQTWAVILIVVIVSLDILIWAVQKWKKYKKKYFTDDPDEEEDTALDLEALELTLDGGSVETSRNLHREMENENYAITPRTNLQRTNSF